MRPTVRLRARIRVAKRSFDRFTRTAVMFITETQVIARDGSNVEPSISEEPETQPVARTGADCFPRRVLHVRLKLASINLAPRVCRSVRVHSFVFCLLFLCVASSAHFSVQYRSRFHFTPDSRAPQHQVLLYCNEEGGYLGDWTKDETCGKYWWKPSSCLLSVHHRGSLRHILKKSKIVFLGRRNAHLLYTNICSRAFGADLCNSDQVQYVEADRFRRFDFNSSVAGLDDVRIVVFSVQHKCEPVLSLHRELGHGRRFAHFLVIDTACPVSNLSGDLHGIINGFKVLDHPELEVSDLRATSPSIDALANVLTDVVYSHIHSKFNPSNSPGSCALVSTAGYLTRFSNGEQIDSHDYVFRTGSGPVVGFESHVGSRTDIRILRHSSFDGNRGTLDINLFSDQILIIHDSIQDATNPLAHKKEADKLRAQDMPYLNFRRWQNNERLRGTIFQHCINFERDLSTGFWAFLLLAFELQTCGSLDLYGFLGHAFPHERYHYFSQGVPGEARETIDHYKSREISPRAHNFSEEQDCLMRFADLLDVSSDKMSFSRKTLARIRAHIPT